MRPTLIFVLAASFWWNETAFFGWNYRAASAEEVICDGIVGVMLAIALLSWPREEQRTNG